MSAGVIVLLNGTSSAGKSSVARAFQDLQFGSGQTFYHLEADLLRDMHPERKRKKEVYMPTLLEAIPACVAALSSSGNNLVVDDVFQPYQLKHYVETLAAFRVLYVGVRCSNAEELLRRERARPDRVGAAEGLARVVYRPGVFDLELDTAAQAPETCAQQIKARLEAGTPFTAFSRLSQMDFDTPA